MPFDQGDLRTFFAAIRSYFSDPDRLQGENVSIISTGQASDGAAIVLFTESTNGPLIGLHIDLDRFAKLFDPNDAETLGRVIATDEIGDPGGPGETRDVDWADRLVAHPQAVGWRLI